MNTKENQEVLTLTEDIFKSEGFGRDFIEKIKAKKWLIARRAFFFLLGFTFYLVYSS